MYFLHSLTSLFPKISKEKNNPMKSNVFPDRFPAHFPTNHQASVFSADRPWKASSTSRDFIGRLALRSSSTRHWSTWPGMMRSFQRLKLALVVGLLIGSRMLDPEAPCGWSMEPKIWRNLGHFKGTCGYIFHTWSTWVREHLHWKARILTFQKGGDSGDKFPVNRSNEPHLGPI